MIEIGQSDFQKKAHPYRCEGCDRTGYIFVESAHAPAFVVCDRCGWEASQVWCPDCEVGGDAIGDAIEDRPGRWTCDGCMKTYELPNMFYHKPFHVYYKKELPRSLRMQLLFPNRSGWWKLPSALLGALGLAGIFIFLCGLNNKIALVYLSCLLLISFFLLLIINRGLTNSGDSSLNPVIIPAQILLLVMASAIIMDLIFQNSPNVLLCGRSVLMLLIAGIIVYTGLSAKHTRYM
jgi:hypothetical protein